MRIDRVFSEGEAVVALQKLGFSCQLAPDRPGQYVVSHPAIGGERTFTVDQLCPFAEAATIVSSHLQAQAATAGARAS